jgi:rhomboid family GlyGly-CTERM serine protease
MATLMVVLPALAIAIVGAETQAVLIYDRDAILAGEFWRLITSNWIHFSVTHLAYDLMVFGIAGTVIELRRHAGFGWFCLLAPVLIGATVFLTRPDLHVFGGLSGLGTGAIVFLVLHGLRQRGAWRWICVAALAAIAIRVGFEFAGAQPIFASGEGMEIRTVPESHAAGGIAAVLVWLLTLRSKFQMRGARVFCYGSADGSG